MILDLPLAWLDRAFHWIWTTSLSAAVLVVIVVIVQLLFRRFLTARWSYALWICVLLRLIIPFVPAADFSIFNLSTGVFVNITPSHSAPVADGVTSPPAQEPRDTVLTFQSGSRTTSPASLDPEHTNTPTRAKYGNIISVAPVVWIIGAISYLPMVFVFHRKLAKRFAARAANCQFASRFDSKRTEGAPGDQKRNCRL